MDQLGVRLECLTCLIPNAEETIYIVFGLRSAVKHQRERHPADLGDWRVLIAGEAEVARAQENTWEFVDPKAMIKSDRVAWRCLHCLDSPAEGLWMTVRDLEIHLSCFHGINDSRVDRDYVKDFAAPELYAAQVG